MTQPDVRCEHLCACAQRRVQTFFYEQCNDLCTIHLVHDPSARPLRTYNAVFFQGGVALHVMLPTRLFLLLLLLSGATCETQCELACRIAFDACKFGKRVVSTALTSSWAELSSM